MFGTWQGSRQRSQVGVSWGRSVAWDKLEDFLQAAREPSAG